MHSDTLEKNPINVINVLKLSLDMMTSSDITAFILVGTPCIITVQSVRFDTQDHKIMRGVFHDAESSVRVTL